MAVQKERAVKHEPRKNIRLPSYDYSMDGAYFVTICAKDRAHLFGNIVGGDVLIAPQMRLSEIGQAVEACIMQIPAIQKYVIMPNHIHFIAVLKKGAMSTSPPTYGLPSLVRFLKRQVTIICGRPVWQRNYYEHIIRSQEDFAEIWHYIDANPQKWQDDCYYTK